MCDALLMPADTNEQTESIRAKGSGTPERLIQGCRRPGRPARSACQAGNLAWPGRPDRDLTGQQAGIHPLIILNLIINSFCDVYSYI